MSFSRQGTAPSQLPSPSRHQASFLSSFSGPPSERQLDQLLSKKSKKPSFLYPLCQRLPSDPPAKTAMFSVPSALQATAQGSDCRVPPRSSQSCQPSS